MKLEVFFDYACPFCLRGYQHLIEALELHPQIEVEWRPCEAHPRPESYGLHSDLCARGMYYALENDADINEYHRIMYNAALVQHVNIEDINIIAECVSGILDSTDFIQKLSAGRYQEKLDENNRLVWEAHGFSAVPSLVMGDNKLNSMEGIGLSKQMILRFIEKN